MTHQIDYLRLSNEHVRILKDFITKANSDQTLEFEIRFGTFQYNKNTKTSTFITGGDIEFFYKLKQSFQKQGYAFTKLQTHEYIYHNINDNGHIKHVIDTQNKSEMYVSKNTLKKYNIFDYDFRLSLAKEIETRNAPSSNLGQPTLLRKKERTTFALPVGKLDLTVVEESNQSPHDASHCFTKYEVELEVDTSNYELVLQFLTVILQIRQNNYYVISNPEKRQIAFEYKDLVKSHFFIGAQPETLQKNDLSSLYKKRYSVTDKADGERMFMFVSKDKLVYFIDSNINKIHKTNLASSSLSNTILDGELVTDSTSIIFLAFDILFHNNVDLRGNTDYLLQARIELMNSVKEKFASKTHQLYKIQTKKYIFKNVFLGSEQILSSKSNLYKNDGLIFTPMDEPYPSMRKWSSLLKWKPAEQNTIDFYSVQQEDGVTWLLYVQHHDKTQPKNSSNSGNSGNSGNGNSSKGTCKVPFDVSMLCDMPSVVDKITTQTTFDETLVDPTTNEPFKSNTVIEYKWDATLDKFVPLRTRWDKTANPKKHGNFSAVACDIWNNIHNPVDKELLIKFTTFSSCKEDLYFERMRRFHNKVKETLYNKYTKDCNFLLELCSGKGGDMHKWVFNSVQNVVGYDISDKNISECQRRIQSIRTPINSTFHKLDLCSEGADQVIMANTPSGFDVVCCHFGVHFFFKSEDSFGNLMKILKSSLHDGGYFIVTCMDDIQINTLFNEQSQCVVSKEINNELIYYLKRDFDSTNQNKPFGNKIRIVLNGNNILGEGSDEYTVNYEDFTRRMKEHSFEVVETSLFSDTGIPQLKSYMQDLSPEEKDISYLNRYIVFKKQKTLMTQIETPLQSICHSSSVLDAVEFDINNLHHHNLGVCKVSTNHDIIDVLNCIEYKFYKNIHSCENLETFEDVQKTFQLYNINTHIPHYVVDPLQTDFFSNTPYTIHFTFHKHSIEKRIDNESEPQATEYKNWYILLLENRLCFSQTQIKNQETKVEMKSEVNVETKIDTNAETKSQSTTKTAAETTAETWTKDGVIRLLEKESKVTIKTLKEILVYFNLKSSGKKEELILRVKEFCA